MRERVIMSGVITWIICGTVYLTYPRAEAQTPKPTPKAPRVTLKAVENPVPAGSFAEVELVGTSKDISKIVEITPTPGKIVEADSKIYFSGLAKTYTVDVTFCDWETRDFYRQKLVITFAQNPNPPNPVDPVNPPTPDKPAPIPVDGFRVMIVFEAMATDGLSKDQQDAIYGQELRDYLNSRCVVGPDGKTKEWRIYDQNVDMTKAPKLWQDAMKRERKSVPWIVVSNGKTGFEGPLPKDTAAIMELLKRY